MSSRYNVVRHIRQRCRISHSHSSFRLLSTRPPRPNPLYLRKVRKRSHPRTKNFPIGAQSLASHGSYICDSRDAPKVLNRHGLFSEKPAKIAGRPGKYTRLQVRCCSALLGYRGADIVSQALMEYHCSKAADIAGRIFERGMENFPDEVELALRYLGFLISINDDASKCSRHRTL